MHRLVGNLIEIIKFNDKTNLCKLLRRHQGGACAEGASKKGLILGAYDDCGELKLSPTAKSYSESIEGKLETLLQKKVVKKDEVRVFYNIQDYDAVAVVGVGKEKAGVSKLESLNKCKENIRRAAGLAAMVLQDDGIAAIGVEEFTNAEAAAEGATLGVWKYQDLASKKEPVPVMDLFGSDDRDGWKRGALKADCQNLARKLEEVPPNFMTPTIFAREVADTLCPCKIHVDIRDRDFVESKKMSAFLAVARGSCEPPMMLELGYCGGKKDDSPIMLIGKGVTFNTGGICLKRCKNMPLYKADMAGAAVIVGVMKAIATMNLPINVNALIPLCENMMSGMALMPGDVLLAMNGKTIRIDDTDHMGRVIMTDCLYYSQIYKPKLIITIGTFATDMWESMGTSSTGVFSTSENVWKLMNYSGAESGDRVWRFPLWKHFSWKVTNFPDVDTSNKGKGRGGDSLRTAAFLREFVPPTRFTHLDITGSGMKATGLGYPYLRKGTMSGRPVRMLVEFIYQSACRHDKGDDC